MKKTLSRRAKAQLTVVRRDCRCNTCGSTICYNEVAYTFNKALHVQGVLLKRSNRRFLCLSCVLTELDEDTSAECLGCLPMSATTFKRLVQDQSVETFCQACLHRIDELDLFDLVNTALPTTAIMYEPVTEDRCRNIILTSDRGVVTILTEAELEEQRMWDASAIRRHAEEIRFWRPDDDKA